ncbi:STAS domain-containing protein [Roseiconus nitratireducens]|uniref:Anti-sigma factor antagonist n=1 Tax=Roseiconus nitratireducens TaxID=2605748 RepID=A0A5M6CZ13_9BACT|nr:STAS domain-containing protein [Roseiconus nitratireducens]KAA5540461.1 STAS domain-containing protein [Roseiconus nitratireducens]
MIDYHTYHHETYPDVLVIEALGKLDLTTADFLLDCMHGMIARGEHKIVLDCSDLESITSVGLGVMVRANSRLKKKGGALAVAGATGIVAEVLKIVHFDKLFHLFPDVDQAAASL